MKSYSEPRFLDTTIVVTSFSVISLTHKIQATIFLDPGLGLVRGREPGILLGRVVAHVTCCGANSLTAIPSARATTRCVLGL